MSRDPRTYAIIGAAIEVHNQLGNGFLEEVYKDALEIELIDRGVPFAREVKLPVFYKSRLLEAYYKADFICFDQVIVEAKALREVGGVEAAQVLNYLKASRHEIGLLVNFGRSSLEYRRFIHSPATTNPNPQRAEDFFDDVDAPADHAMHQHS